METKIFNRQTCKTGNGKISAPSLTIHKSGKICLNTKAVNQLNAEYIQLIKQDDKLYICKAKDNFGFRLRSDKDKRTYRVFNSKALVKSLSIALNVGHKKIITSAAFPISTDINLIDGLGDMSGAIEVYIDKPIRMKTEFDPNV